MSLIIIIKLIYWNMKRIPIGYRFLNSPNIYDRLHTMLLGESTFLSSIASLECTNDLAKRDKEIKFSAPYFAL